MRASGDCDRRMCCGPLIVRDQVASQPLKVRIFELIRAAGPISRAQVAKDLRISPATVSTLTAELIAAGVLQTVGGAHGPGDAVRGRPPVGLAVRPEAHTVAGIKLSTRERTGILVDFAGNKLASIRVAVRADELNPEAQIAGMGRMLDIMLDEIGRTRRDLSAVGVGLPGFVDHLSGRVVWSPVLDARETDFADMAGHRLGLPVTIDNDANLVALAELWFGKGREKSDFAVVTIEQGVGMGMVLNHRLFRGANGFGLELGHTKVQIDGALCRCGQRGCLEAYLADYAIAREASVALNLGTAGLPVPELIDRLHRTAERGGEAAQSIFRAARRYLAAGLSSAVNLFDPSLLILSGGRMRYDWLDRAALLDEMRDFVIDAGQDLPPLVIHEWGDLLWARGAAALALSQVAECEIGVAREAVA